MYPTLNMGARRRHGRGLQSGQVGDAGLDAGGHVCLAPHRAGVSARTTLLPTYLPACIPTFLSTFISTYLPSYLLGLPTYLPTCLPAYLPTYIHTCLPACLSAYALVERNAVAMLDSTQEGMFASRRIEPG